jgi:hypothetical protein
MEAVKRGKGSTLFVLLFEDSDAKLRLLVALAPLISIQITDNLYADADAAASIVTGLTVGQAVICLAFETRGLLIGKSANLGPVNGTRSLLQGSERSKLLT